MYARSLALGDGTNTAVLVSVEAVAIAEIGTIQNDFLANVRAQLQEELSLRPQNLLINACHCHVVMCLDVEERTVRAVKEAWANMVPVAMGVGTGREDRIMENRRLRDGGETDVRMIHGLPPDEEILEVGPVDPEICIRRLDRRRAPFGDAQQDSTGFRAGHRIHLCGMRSLDGG